MDDLINRQAAIDAHCELCGDRDRCNCDICPDVEVFQLLPSAQPDIARSIATIIENEKDMRVILKNAQPEPLTDKEQRIFLAAMEREERVCEEVDRNYVREPYEDSLRSVCREIKRKVKGALWT